MKRFRIVFSCLLCLTMAAVSGSVTACGDMSSGGGSSSSSSGGSSGGGGY